MPADRTQRIVRHVQSTRRETRRLSIQQTDEGNDNLASSSEPEHASLTKKHKQQVRHDALMRRLGTPSAPYSKSHMRRLKRTAKGELSTDLKSMREALPAVEAQDGPRLQPGQTTGPHADGPNAPSPKRRYGQIGEGKHTSLTMKQRKRAFQVENLRHKLIIADKNFASNPFQTLRTHAQNTLVEHHRTAHQPS